MNKRDIVDLVEGRLGKRRKKEVIDWLLKNPKEQETYHLLKAKRVASSLKNVEERTPSSFGPRYLRAGKFLKYASILVILFLSSYVIWNEVTRGRLATNPTILLATTSIGESKKVVLSDGTEVMLNANSILSYPSKFSGKTREIVLRGEAFFEVTKDKTKPFIVNTDSGLKIKVLGTSFNVKAYEEDRSVETTLVSGKVRITDNKDRKEVILHPSQQATYVKTEGKVIVDKVRTENFTAWREGKLVYDETPMRQVIGDLKRAYKINLQVKSPEILDYKYTGVFDNLSVEQVLNLFELSSPIKYKINNNKIILEMEK